MNWHNPVIWSIFCAIIPEAAAQLRFSPGINAGIPLTETLLSSSYTSTSDTSTYFERYNSKRKLPLIGPTLRLDLPRGLGLEFDALYQRVNYDHATSSSAPGLFSTQSFEQGTANRWQFPLLVQYNWKIAKVRPFVEAGPSISTIANGRSKAASKSVYAPGPAMSSASGQSLPAATIAGITAGGGISLPVLGRHLRAEVRFSRWFTPAAGYNATSIFRIGDFSSVLPAASSYFDLGTGQPFRIQKNEAVFLLGLSF